ncbi:MAG TPA: aromatic ring-hydroxylating dioxygenase subunit alpha [Actinomycetota bacterium]|nr:aromatic ring-hydroxylating dioxygenase subunit alpha [Actinomycetota bacterium]
MPTPAPIDPDALRRCVAPDRDVRTLPAAAYVSDAVHRWELEHFFDASWVCVGRSSALATPGDQAAVRAGTQAVLLVRGTDGELRGFFNTCRHRGHELLPCGGGPVNQSVVRCPYHRWTYALDGAFKGGPGLAGQAGFDRRDREHDLVAARVREWRGWAFVNVSGDAPPFDRHVGRLDELVAAHELERVVPAASHSYDLRANWKIAVENYHECYHCSEIHPELCRVTTPGSGDHFAPSGLVVGGSMLLDDGMATMSFDGASRAAPFRRLSGRALREVHYVQVWPNLLLSVHPDYVMTHVLTPLAAGRTEVACEWSFAPEALERPGFDPSFAVDFWDLTNRQDWAACESVQRGAAGRGYRQAPLSRHERNVADVIAMVATGYLDGGPPTPVDAQPRERSRSVARTT